MISLLLHPYDSWGTEESRRTKRPRVVPESLSLYTRGTRTLLASVLDTRTPVASQGEWGNHASFRALCPLELGVGPGYSHKHIWVLLLGKRGLDNLSNRQDHGCIGKWLTTHWFLFYVRFCVSHWCSFFLAIFSWYRKATNLWHFYIKI